MRKGQNPAKFVNQVAKPERVTVALLNYIPFLSGFYAQALDVLKVSLESMRNNPGLPFDLMVFDNDSCPEVRDFLIGEKDAGRIQYLILSEKNLGKGGAWNILLAGAPGEIISYTDSDVLFYPQWLSRSVEVLETFPNVGMVTGRPFRTNPDFHTSTREWARTNATLEEGCFIPWETFWEFNRSLGQDEAENRKVYSEGRDWKITYTMPFPYPQRAFGSGDDVRGAHVAATQYLPVWAGEQSPLEPETAAPQEQRLAVTAYVGASHWQFTAYKSVLQQFLPFEMDKPMGQVKQLDQRMNERGLLRLMISDPLTMNLSNTTDYVRGNVQKPAKASQKSLSQRLVNLPPIRKMLLAVYDQIFRWYYS